MENDGYTTDIEDGRGKINPPKPKFTHVSFNTSDSNSESDGKNPNVGKTEEENSTNKKTVEEFQSKKFPQLLAAFACHIGAFAFGNVLCYSAVAFPKLRVDYDSFGGKPTELEISWLSSVIALGSVIVSLPAGRAVDTFGRRRTMLFLTLPFVSGWLLISFAQNFVMMLIGRFVTGFCGGAFALVAPIFLAETSETKIRGMLINAYDLMASIGIVFVLTIGTFLPWRTQALVCAFVPFFFCAILFFVPESPRHLLSKGQEKEAEESLCWFRGVDYKTSAHLVKPEFFALMENLEQNKGEGWRAQWEELKTRPVLKGLCMSFMLFFFQVFCGICTIDLYSVDIFTSSGSTFDEYASSIIIGVVGIVMSVCSALVVDKFGRRILLAASETVMALSLVALGGFFFMKERNHEWTLHHFSWLPVTSLMFFIGGFAIGVGPIPFSFMPEVLPQRVRGLVSSMLILSKWTMSFFIARYFKDFMGAVGDATGYWCFASVCFLGLLFVILFLPETKGKTLEEIQKEMTGKSKSKNTKKIDDVEA